MTEEGQSGLDKSWIPFGGGARKCMGYNFAIMEIKVSPSLHIGCCILAQAQLTWHDSIKSYMHYTTPCIGVKEHFVAHCLLKQTQCAQSYS